ncbi:MAG: hypothetical protein Q9174_002271 [Haloplaca sp. 1 TL-2023]
MSYIAFSSNLSPKLRARMEHFTGVSTQQVLETQRRKEGYEPNESSTTRVNRTDYTRSLHSSDSRIEAGLENDAAHNLPPGTAITTNAGRDRHGMAVNQDIALANLDPRTRSGKEGPRLGVSTVVGKDEQRDDVHDGIAVRRDWRLDSE